MSAERVFISYRRADTSHFVGRLQEVISERYGRDSVFMDVESIRPGEDYVIAIDDAVSRSRVLLVVIGSGWLAAETDGRRRLDNPQDRLRLEVEAGLRHTTHVIPVLVDEASMPKTGQLPESLVPLSRHHAIRIRHDSFRGDTTHLFEILDQYLGETSRSPTRWLTVALLGVLALGLVIYQTEGSAAVAESRSPRGEWAADDVRARLLWLMPVLPAALALGLIAVRKAPGVALGCLLGATLWVLTSLVFVAWRAAGITTTTHLVALLVLLLAIVSLVLGEPRLRAPVGANRGAPAAAAALLMVAAIVLRVGATAIAATLTGNHAGFDLADQASQPPFWLSVLIPLLICLPAVLARLNDAQAQTLRTVAWLQIAYPIYFRAVSLGDARDVPQAAVSAVIFVAGCVCLLLSVRAGQRGAASPRAAPRGSGSQPSLN
jgi:hypothetical protein